MLLRSKLCPQLVHVRNVLQYDRPAMIWRGTRLMDLLPSSATEWQNWLQARNFAGGSRALEFD